MVQITVIGKRKGFFYIVVLFAVFLISLGFLKAFEEWEKILKKDREEELIFRGYQFIRAIDAYRRKYAGALPRSLKELKDKKLIRKLYKEPMSQEGKWNIIIENPKGSQSQIKFLVIPYYKIKKYEGSIRIIGVSSPVHEKAFKIYKKREYYDEWLFVPGIKDKIPDFEVLN